MREVWAAPKGPRSNAPGAAIRFELWLARAHQRSSSTQPSFPCTPQSAPHLAYHETAAFVSTGCVDRRREIQTTGNAPVELLPDHGSRPAAADGGLSLRPGHPFAGAARSSVLRLFHTCDMHRKRRWDKRHRFASRPTASAKGEESHDDDRRKLPSSTARGSGRFGACVRSWGNGAGSKLQRA